MIGGNLFGMIRQFVLSKGGSTFIGLLALIGLIWFGLPYVGIDDRNHRFILIGMVLGFTLTYFIIRWVVVRIRGSRFQKDLQGQGDGQQAEIDALKKKMIEAIASLKTSELGLKYRGTAALYALPWFMIIGPSAAGKSTLLRNSGLHFPYSQSEDVDIKGFGGTRNCDWWFSDEAVILDTAGRYTTEDDDHQEWKAFLNLLKKHRRKMPINGILVAVSIADLLTADEETLEWHVKVIRERIDELINNLGFMFPFYLIFTKCDLLNGFQSFFSDSSERERGQVWGSYLDGFKGKEDPTDKIGVHLDKLHARLCEQRLLKLSMQRKHAIKSEIFDFPAQFQAASDKLLEFITLLFKDNPYQETPNFKGVYFTSGTQEGLPLQRVVGNMRQAFGYVERTPDEQNKSEKSYFIHELLTKIIFKAPKDVLMSRRKQLITRGLKSATVLAGLAAIVTSTLVFSAAFTSNALNFNNGTSAVDYVREAGSNERLGSVEQYDSLVTLYRHYADLKKTIKQQSWNRTWNRKLGLYRADEQIRPIENLLISLMESHFLKPVAVALEDRLSRFSQYWQKSSQDKRAEMRNEYYETLKVYLMLGQPGHMNESEAMSLLYRTWRAVIAPGDNSQARTELAKIPENDIKKLISLYLNHMKLASGHQGSASSWQVSSRIVEPARDQLRTPPNADLLYAQLKNKGRVLLKTRRLEHLLKSRGSNYLESEYELPVLYTRAGWETFASREIAIMVNSASRGDWVMGTGNVYVSSSATQPHSVDQDEVNKELWTDLEQGIRQLYFTEYSQTWHRFLASISIQKFTSVPDSARKLLLLSREDGPLGKLMQVVSNNVQLNEVHWKPAEIGSKGEKGIRSAKSIPELETAFSDLRRFSVPEPKKATSTDFAKYLGTLSALQVEMEQLRTSSELERDAEMFSSKILSGKGGETGLYKGWVTTTSILNGTAVTTRRSVEPMLMAPIKQSWQAILSTAMQEVQYKWQNMVVREFDERIRGRFPFSSRGPDAAIDDVAEFFRPEDGILWSFVNQHLSSYLIKHRSRWKERNWLGYGPGFDRRFLMTLNRSQVVTRSLFKRGSDVPDVTFYLYPVPTTGLSEITLETNGQTYRYRNEPQEWRKFSWPGSADQSGARLVGVSNRNNTRAELSAQGLWGLFHLFGKAKVVKEGGAQYLSVWDMESVNGKPIKVKFKVKADRYSNVFQPGLMRGLSMPEHLATLPRSGTNLARKE